MKLLDTSVAVDHLRGAQPAAHLLSRLVDADEPVVASEVVRFELLAGGREAIEAAADAPYLPLTTIDDVYPERPDRET